MYKNKDIVEYEFYKTNLWDFDEISFEYGAYAVKDFLENCIKTYDNYLVFAFNCRWNSTSGYMFKQDIFDCVVRDYDCSQYVWAISKNNKAMLLKEFYHDKPYGHSTVIIGLTDKEYAKLENADFFEIKNFAKKYLDTLHIAKLKTGSKYLSA